MLSRLLNLSIVQKVSSELENHVGIGDQDLAEFIIELKRQSSTAAEFEKKLQEKGGDEFDASFIQSLWRIIEAMTPRHQSTATENERPSKMEAIAKKNAHTKADESISSIKSFNHHVTNDEDEYQPSYAELNALFLHFSIMTLGHVFDKSPRAFFLKHISKNKHLCEYVKWYRVAGPLTSTENTSKFACLNIPNSHPIRAEKISTKEKEAHEKELNAHRDIYERDNNVDSNVQQQERSHPLNEDKLSGEKEREREKGKHRRGSNSSPSRSQSHESGHSRSGSYNRSYSRSRNRSRSRSRSRSRGRGRHEDKHTKQRTRGHNTRNKASDTDVDPDRHISGKNGDNANSKSERRSRWGDSKATVSSPEKGREKEKEDEEVIKYKIYDGIVDSVRDFGVFVTLKGVRGSTGTKVTGLVHRNFVTADTPVPIVSNYVKRGMQVKVKVITNTNGKISLSMRSVDQRTGQDMAPRPNQSHLSLSDETKDQHHHLSSSSVSASASSRDGVVLDDARDNPSRPIAGRFDRQRSDEEDDETQHRRRVSSPERWEIRQLQSAGVWEPEDDPNYDADTGVLETNLEPEQELDIELNEHEPAFLRGQTSLSSEVEPVKVVKNPDGSLQRAALLSSAMAKERREIRDAKMKQETDSVPVNLSKSWVDPISFEHDRVFAQQLRNMGQGPTNIPEWKRATSGRNFALGMSRNIPIQEQRRSLPIYKFKNELLKAVKENDILVVIGQTGSGKTTQITQYLAETGYASYGAIGCTQPRRVAAMSVAQRVSEEYGCRLGQEVGYSIRFEDCTSPDTIIKYMTDGMLLRECLLDVNLKRYSVIMLDEAHERAINTDVMFALLKQCVMRRNKLKSDSPNNENGSEKEDNATDAENDEPQCKPLKLIITSATLDAEKFSTYFNHCPIFTIPGRLYPVTILYSRQSDPDYLEAALITVLNIHLSEPMGIFCALPSEMQTRIFEPAPDGTRKCVVATNIAEASLTIDGIYYVVDPGFVKQQVYNPKLRMNSLVITPISQNSANQRAGRAGRTGPGKCFRLYTQAAYKNEMLKATVPEIQRTNLGNVVLTLKALGINNLLSFDFMDPPNPATLVSAMQQLYNLGSLDEEGLLTRLGRRMAEFPLEPQLSKILIAAVDLRCAEEVLTVVAMLQADNIWFRPREKQAVADQRRARFFQPEGDHITLLHVFEAWKEAKYSNPWCRNNYIQARAMRHALDVRKQLIAIMDRYGLEVESCKKNYVRVRKAIASGYFMHSARKDPQEGYKTLVEGQPAYIHPSSALFNHQPDYLIFHNLVLTSKEKLIQSACLVENEEKKLNLFMIDMQSLMRGDCQEDDINCNFLILLAVSIIFCLLGFIVWLLLQSNSEYHNKKFHCLQNFKSNVVSTFRTGNFLIL
ncbi:hypothetical protein RFI_05685 [Reticulomyxa filosa]|uniref:RNA helicase n=1 Tax=Reticulomyxa filosa TaxID=46433 RepID=X6P1L5_RETFI|nr:hypothetical protein RFI_05685 [Reticulomyxa filosa]|eukprot:ETO31437.1 hypothetical protein RFI_05685 [Reticulomyxa filosa]